MNYPDHWSHWRTSIKRIIACIFSSTLDSHNYILIAINRVMKIKPLHNLSHVMRKPVYAIFQTTKVQISAFVVHCLDSIIPLVSISQIPSLYLASVAAQASLRLPWLQTLKTGFLMTSLILCFCFTDTPTTVFYPYIYSSNHVFSLIIFFEVLSMSAFY